MIEAASQDSINELFKRFGDRKEQKPDARNGASFDVAEYLREHGIEVVRVKKEATGTRYCLKECVFDAGHDYNEASIFQEAGGRLVYQCFHDSCKGRTWHDARKIISGDEPIRAADNDADADDAVVTLGIISMQDLLESDVPEPTPIIDGILWEEETLVIAGPSNIGKSALANLIALHAANSIPLWNMFPIPEPVTVLYLQAENTIKSQKVRIKLLLSARPDLKENLCRFHMPTLGGDCRVDGDLMDSGFQDAVKGLIHHSGAKILIVDPLVEYHDAEENDNGAMKRLFSELHKIRQEMKNASIVLHHFGKNNTPRGASSIKGKVDGVLELHYHDENADDSIIRVVHGKCRNAQKKLPFFIQRTKMLDFVKIDAPGKHDNRVDIVVKCLSDIGGVVQKKDELVEEVKEMTGMQKSTAHTIIDRAVEMGKIIKKKGAGKGAPTRYFLPE